MLTVFHLGTGGKDIGKALTMMGVPGGRHFERSFHRHASHVSSVVRSCNKRIIEESSIVEIKLSICDLYDKEELDMNYINQCLNQQKFEDLPVNLPLIDISVSYDMGWQKRAGGRIYDSLSGHGFLVDCRSKKVVRMGVFQKNAQFVILTWVGTYKFPTMFALLTTRSHFETSLTFTRDLTVRLFKPN